MSKLIVFLCLLFSVNAINNGVHTPCLVVYNNQMHVWVFNHETVCKEKEKKWCEEEEGDFNECMRKNHDYCDYTIESCAEDLTCRGDFGEYWEEFCDSEDKCGYENIGEGKKGRCQPDDFVLSVGWIITFSLVGAVTVAILAYVILKFRNKEWGSEAKQVRDRVNPREYQMVELKF